MFLLVFKINSHAEPIDLQEIGKSVTDIAKGVIEKIPDAIPAPEDIFQAGKNLIAGYPFEQVNLNPFFMHISYSNERLLTNKTIRQLFSYRYFRQSTHFVSEFR